MYSVNYSNYSTDLNIVSEKKYIIIVYNENKEKFKKN